MCKVSSKSERVTKGPYKKIVNLAWKDPEMIKVSIDSGRFGCGIFVDLRKAFETVNHKILLTKLEHCRIRNSILK